MILYSILLTCIRKYGLTTSCFVYTFPFCIWYKCAYMCTRLVHIYAYFTRWTFFSSPSFCILANVFNIKKRFSLTFFVGWQWGEEGEEYERYNGRKEAESESPTSSCPEFCIVIFVLLFGSVMPLIHVQYWTINEGNFGMLLLSITWECAWAVE